MRNHGASPHSSAMDYDSMAADVERTLRSFTHSKSCTLMGHSMGGRVAMKVASMYPDLVDKLIVVDVSPESGKPEAAELMSDYLDVMLELNHANLRTRIEAEKYVASRVEVIALYDFVRKSNRVNMIILNNSLEIIF
jgi:pimeloyl-ACP methyl ester carboxylesterase